VPSAAVSFASNSSNGFALSVEDEEDDAEGLEVLGLKRSDMEAEAGHMQEVYAVPAARRKLQLGELPKGWRQQPAQQPLQQAEPVVVNASNGSRYSSAAGSNGNGKGLAAQSGSNGAGASETPPQQQQQQQQQLVGAANDIVPLGSKMSGGGSASSKAQQTAQRQ
jgi:hypothetical protein